MLRNVRTLVLALFSAAVLNVGSASAIVVDFTGGGTGAGSGVSLSCAATGIFNYGGCSVTHNAAGLGVNGRPDTQPGQIDGSPIFSAERLTLSFAQDMVWNTITMGLWDRNDDVRFERDGGVNLFSYAGNNPVVNLGGVVSRSLTVIAYGDIRNDCAYLFCLGLKGDDSFTVASLDVAPVPLPAAGWMLLAGIGGIAALRAGRRAVQEA